MVSCKHIDNSAYIKTIFQFSPDPGKHHHIKKSIGNKSELLGTCRIDLLLSNSWWIRVKSSAYMEPKGDACILLVRPVNFAVYYENMKSKYPGNYSGDHIFDSAEISNMLS